MDVGLTPIMLSKISKTKTWTSVLRISMLASTRRSCLYFILDPRAPPPNVYVIPDLMGSTMAPHTAHVNWRPFTPERKFQFNIIYIISKCIASVRNHCHRTRNFHTLQPLPFGCLKNFTLLLVVARAG